MSTHPIQSASLPAQQHSRRLRAMIVDDEASCQESLSHLLSRYCPGVELEARCTSVAEALEAIPAIAPNLVFLDVMLSDGTGFDVLQGIGTPEFHVIFTTAHDQFAIRAIRFAALDYLLKPVSPTDLMTAVDKAMSISSESRAQSAHLRVLHEHLALGPGKEAKIALPTLTGFEFLPLHELVCCEASGNYTRCCLASGTILVASRSLKEFEDMLADHRFFRIHHSSLINLAHLRRYVRGKGGYVVLSNGKEYEVSVRRREEFITALGV